MMSAVPPAGELLEQRPDLRRPLGRPGIGIERHLPRHHAHRMVLVGPITFLVTMEGDGRFETPDHRGAMTSAPRK
jgi:hypothetical protein